MKYKIHQISYLIHLNLQTEASAIRKLIFSRYHIKNAKSNLKFSNSEVRIFIRLQF